VVIVTGAFFAQHASTVNGLLHVEGGVLNRVEIQPGGKAYVTLVVILETLSEESDAVLNVVKVFPDESQEPFPSLAIPAHKFRGETGFVWFDLHMDAPMEGRYVLLVSAQGSGPAPVEDELAEQLGGLGPSGVVPAPITLHAAPAIR
jgi:hypothetical protein